MIVYQGFLNNLASAAFDWRSANIKALLESSTSRYTPDPAHQTLYHLRLLGFEEISVPGYTRASVADRHIYYNDLLNRLELRCANLQFGQPAAGATVKGIVFYVQIGTEPNENQDYLISYANDITGLPKETDGKLFLLRVPQTLFYLQAAA